MNKALLEPCALCGGMPRLTWSDHLSDETGHATVRCDRCHATGSISLRYALPKGGSTNDDYFQNVAKCVKEWNLLQIDTRAAVEASADDDDHS